jgi:hypothetical protein
LKRSLSYNAIAELRLKVVLAELHLQVVAIAAFLAEEAEGS